MAEKRQIDQATIEKLSALLRERNRIRDLGVVRWLGRSFCVILRWASIKGYVAA